MRTLTALLLIAAPSLAVAQTVPYTFPNPVNAEGAQIPTQKTFALNTGFATIDGSGAIAASNVSQTVFAARPTRTRLICQNPVAATEILLINFGTAAGTANGSIELAPGGTMTLLGPAVPVEAINVTAATAGHRFVCKQG